MGAIMKQIKKRKPTKKYAKSVSLWPLKPEDALLAFMQIDPRKVKTGRV
jgi:hypothetical protein